jgi:fatty acid desaturase
MDIQATPSVLAGATRARGVPATTEWPTLAVALGTHGGLLLLTGYFHELPLPVAAAFGSILLAWYGSLQHETIHGHPTRWRRINNAIAGPPWALWIPYTLYRETHLRHHRHGGRHLTEVGHDPETFYLPALSFSRMGRLLSWAHRANGTLAGRLTIGPAIAIGSFWRSELRRVVHGDRKRLRVWGRHFAAVAIVLIWVCGVCRVPVWVYLALVVYPSVALTQLRSFVEHHDDVDPRMRTRVVEAHPLWALVFLNNNLHVAHHAHPRLAWYELPGAWRQMRPSTPRGLVFDGYRDVTRRYLFRPYITPTRGRE